MITPEEIKNLASLARLEVSEAESAKLQHDLGAILDYVGELKSVKASGEEEKDLGENVNNLREDKDALPSLETGEFVKVKKIL